MRISLWNMRSTIKNGKNDMTNFVGLTELIEKCDKISGTGGVDNTKRVVNSFDASFPLTFSVLLPTSRKYCITLTKNGFLKM